MRPFSILKNQKNPTCFHCGKLKDGSIVFRDEENYWCIFCAYNHDLLTEEELTELDQHQGG